MTVGDVFTVEEAAGAILGRVSLRNPEGLELEGSYIAPVTDLAFGTDTYPPSNPLWDIRTDVDGARVTPGTTYSFILVLRPTGDGPHTAEGFDVTYEASGVSYRKQNTTGYVLQKDCIS